MKRVGPTLAIYVALGSSLALPQAAPFDMTPERPAVAAPPPIQTPPAKQDAPAEPDAQARPASPAPSPSADLRRYVVPFSKLVLSGETEQKNWAIYLTPEQAASAASFHIGYQSSIVVAPETSQLQFSINGTVLVKDPVRAPDKIKEITVAVAPGVLRPGINLVSISVEQRHRTDCTVESTYDLWSEIDPTRTFLSFADQKTRSFSRLDDIRAIGTDGNGQTTFNLVAPSFDQSATTASLIRLAEGLALLAGTPNQSITVAKTAPQKPSPGSLTVAVGTAVELADVVGQLPDGANSVPLVQFVDDPKLGPSTLVVVAPSWQALSGAIESLVKPTDRPRDVLRTLLETQFWHAPDTPFLMEGGRLPFSALGMETQEFSGRRFRTDFMVGVPADFFANAYGEARILIDAAYSDRVLPGSHIDIYVNGNIAATVPITTAGGGIMRHLPIGVTMRHFRPGANTITIEAVVTTREDAVCSPGATANSNPRFALFDTSEFFMPRYARIGQRPNLSAVAGTGFPYNRPLTPIPLLVTPNDADAFSAAATLLARISLAAGRPIQVEPVTNAGLTGNRDAIFVGPVAQLPAGVLTQVGVAQDSSTAWGEAAEQATLARPDTEATFTRWRDQLSGRGWSGQVSALQDWFTRNFDITLSSLRLAPAASEDFTPGGSITSLIAQGGSVTGEGTWTIATAPTAKDLAQSMRAMTTQPIWSQVTGRIFAYEASGSEVHTIPVGQIAFIPTQPFSFENFRLIASNWLSANILSYAAFLFALCTLLGLITAALLATFGRRK
jgi:hypothetical protein